MALALDPTIAAWFRFSWSAVYITALNIVTFDRESALKMRGQAEH